MRMILRGSLILAFSNICVRLLALLRDSLVVAYFGTGLISDSYLVGTTLATVLLPSLTSALVTVYVAYVSDTESLSREQRKLTLFGITLGILVFLLAPQITHMLAPDLTGQGYELAVVVTRWSSPAITLSIMGTVPSARLLMSGQYGLLTLGNIFVSALSVVLLYLVGRQQGIVWTMIGMSAGTGVQWLLLTFSAKPVLRPETQPLVPRPKRHQYGVIKKILPLLISGFAASLGQVILRGLGSSVGEAVVTHLTYGLRAVMLPVGMISTPFVISAHAQITKDIQEGRFSSNGLSALRLPISGSILGFVGVATFAPEIMQVLFEYGKFTSADTLATAKAVLWLSPSVLLLPIWDLGNRLLVSLDEHRWLVPTGAAAATTNVVAALVLVGPLHGFGLVVAMLFGQAVAVAILGWRLGPYLLTGQTSRFGLTAGMYLVVGGVVGIVARYASDRLKAALPYDGFWESALVLTCAGIVGLLPLFYLFWKKRTAASTGRPDHA